MRDIGRMAALALLILPLCRSAHAQIEWNSRTLTAHGSIRVREGDQQYVPRAGAMELWFKYYCDWHPVVAVVVNGDWRADIPDPVFCGVAARIVLDGREAHADWRYYFDDEQKRNEPIQARWTVPTRIEVVDASDGRQLSDVEVIESEANVTPQGWTSWPIAVHASSPVAVPAWSQDFQPFVDRGWSPTLSIWLRAPGHAWKRMHGDVERGGTQRISLERSGELELEIRDHLGRGNMWAELFSSRTGGTRASFPLKPNRALRIESLPTGEYRVVLVQRHETRFERTVVAWRVVEVGATETSCAVFLRSR